MEADARRPGSYRRVGVNAREQVTEMQTRTPVVAGQFYAAERGACIEEIRECLAARSLGVSLPASIAGGIVPHAGWTFSGDLAALVFSAVKQCHETVDTFVIFGTAHSYFGSLPAVDDSETWQTPLGSVEVDTAFRDALCDTGLVVSDAAAHRHEHSIEVEVPFLQHLFPNARIVPIVVPPADSAIALGEASASIAKAAKRKVVFIGSTDLTHYGPRYGFTPMGRRPEGLQWAANVNDRQFIDLAVALEAEHLLSGAIEKGNACGPGAAAACVAAARTRGATEGLLLAYANSNEVMHRKMGTTSRDSVGYAAIVL
jgi:AmmeMemoRadiSam system protein B